MNRLMRHHMYFSNPGAACLANGQNHLLHLRGRLKQYLACLQVATMGYLLRHVRSALRHRARFAKFSRTVVKNNCAPPDGVLACGTSSYSNTRHTSPEDTKKHVRTIAHVRQCVELHRGDGARPISQTHSNVSTRPRPPAYQGFAYQGCFVHTPVDFPSKCNNTYPAAANVVCRAGSCRLLRGTRRCLCLVALLL